MPEHTRPNRSAHQLLRNWHFVSNGTEVPGEVGTQFGIEFPIDGSAVGDGKTLHLVLNFPPQGLRNPNTSDMMHTARIALPNLKIGALCLLGYGFDNAWEIVPGSGPSRSGIRTACLPSKPLR